MMFKNSVKLLTSNFITVWKMLLYKLVVVLIIGGLFCVTINTLSSLPNFAYLIEKAKDFLYSYNFSTAPVNSTLQFGELIKVAGNNIVELFAHSPLTFVYLVFLFFVLLPYLWHLADLAVGEIIYGYMSSQTKFSFVGLLFEKFNKASIYSINLTLTLLPINVLIFGGLIGILYLAIFGGFLLYFLPFFTMLWILVCYSLRITVLSGWIPSMVVNNINALEGFKKGIKVVSRRFYRTLSTCVVTMFAFVALMAFLGVFGLILALPIMSIFVVIIGMVMYFSSQGMRYYVDMETITTSPKLAETDKIRRLKNII